MQPIAPSSLGSGPGSNGHFLGGFDQIIPVEIVPLDAHGKPPESEFNFQISHTRQS
jgi:hypothetical protein